MKGDNIALKQSKSTVSFADLQKEQIKKTKRMIAESLKRDHLIVQAVNNIEEIDKVANNLSKRLREWYELYNPEFSRSIEDHKKFTQLILKNDKEKLLAELGIRPEDSMGADFSKKDLEPIMNLAKKIQDLYELRKEQMEYVESLMQELCKNVYAITGAMIGAKLLAIAGSLEKLSQFPASTIQVLGAEKALFRHMKTGSKPPKFGVLMSHPLVMGAKKQDKGKAARVLADKISIASKVDFFKGDFIGDRLREEVEERFK